MVIATTDLVTLYNSGMSQEAIGRKISMSKGWVAKKLRGKVSPHKACCQSRIYETTGWHTTEERDRLIIKLYQSGDGTLIISKKLKIAKRTASKVLNRNGIIDKSRTALKLPPETINHWYDSGLSLSQIAAKLSCSENAIRHHVKNPRVPAEALYKIPKHLRDKILHLYVVDGLSSYQIASEFGYTYQRVQNFLRRQKVSVGSLTPAWKAAVQRGIKHDGSSLEKVVEQILVKLKLTYQRQYELGEFRYDFGIMDGTILIEVQGSYWHGMKNRISRDIYKRNLAIKNGKKLLIIWDYELSKLEVVKCKILNATNPVLFDFSNLEVKTADWMEAKALLDSFHYQKCGRAGISIGAYHDQILVAVAIFCKPMRQETATKQNLNYSENS